jgi:hypothetical protein
MRYDGVRFWAWGNSGKIISSTDGITWENVSVSGGGDIIGVAAVSLGGQYLYTCQEVSSGSIRVGTTLGTWSYYPLDNFTSDSNANQGSFVYFPTIKRLFMQMSTATVYSKVVYV